MRLIHGDTLEKMALLPDGSIDLILADLPYGTTRNKWDTIIEFKKLWQQYERLIKPNGAILLFGQEPFASQLRISNLSLYRYDWTWIKTQATGFLNSKRMPLKNNETISVFYKKLPTYNPQMRSGYKPYKVAAGKASQNYGEQEQVTTVQDSGERYPITTLTFSKDSTKLHPTQKPIALLEYLIKTYSNPGDLVLDNVMGSGSTGVAAINTDRDFIGIELNDEYFEIAKNRIEAVEQG